VQAFFGQQARQPKADTLPLPAAGPAAASTAVKPAPSREVRPA
jgi:hypothetical protein